MTEPNAHYPCYLFLLLWLLLIAGPAAAATLTIDYPSENETAMAECRDFYVTGAIPAGIAVPGDVRIELFRGTNAVGTPVRMLESHVDPVNGTTPLSAIATDYSNGTPKGTVLVPDLVREPGGLRETWNKVVVTPQYYAGVILGGVTKTFDTNYTDLDGRPLADLVAGDYTIRVTGLSGGLANLTAEKRITLGKTHAALGRFSPTVQKERLIAFAREHGYRIYFDSFPGYFYWNSTGYVIPGRWVPNNAIEVSNDCPGTLVDTVATAENDLFLYDVRNYSATYTVETSTIIRTALVDSPRTAFHYYTAGEPMYTYVTQNGTRISLNSSLATLAHGDRLALTRAELRPSTALDPTVDLVDPTPKRLDLSPDDGIAVASGEGCILYGVVAPIPATVVSGPSGRDGTPVNRIASVAWSLVDGNGTAIAASTIPVQLGRRLDPAKPAEIVYSTYEFGGIVGTGVNAGRYLLCLEAHDETGAVVDGTREQLPFTVEGAPTPTVTVPPTTIAPTPTPTRQPYKAHPIPGRVEAEDYDTGRAGGAWFDRTPGNQGGAYRQDDVDIERGGSNYDIGWVKSSEWLEYTLTIGTSGTYRASFRVASPWTGRQLRILVDGVHRATVAVPRTGGFARWQTVTVPVALPKGMHRVRVQFVGDAQNLDWLEFRA
ncbi:MAG: carbohydrate-binding protein [Methanospirillum sp.]